jgi:Putative transposase of IS4/5 family (DUF4096)
VAVAQTVTVVLRWSWWRRWHQAWARYHHYCRRARVLGVLDDLVVFSDAELEVSPDVVDVVWCRLELWLAQVPHSGRPWTHSRRVVLEAIVWVMRSGGTWRDLPEAFPPWETVYSQLVRWRVLGVWELIWAGLDDPDLRV